MTWTEWRRRVFDLHRRGISEKMRDDLLVMHTQNEPRSVELLTQLEGLSQQDLTAVSARMGMKNL